jgi:hypothetical protein
MSQPLRFYPALSGCSPAIRATWEESLLGLHWESIDEDISFASFSWCDEDPLTLYHDPLPAHQRSNEVKKIARAPFRPFQYFLLIISA